MNALGDRELDAVDLAGNRTDPPWIDQSAGSNQCTSRSADRDRGTARKPSGHAH